MLTPIYCKEELMESFLRWFSTRWWTYFNYIAACFLFLAWIVYLMNGEGELMGFLKLWLTTVAFIIVWAIFPAFFTEEGSSDPKGLTGRFDGGEGGRKVILTRVYFRTLIYWMGYTTFIYWLFYLMSGSAIDAALSKYLFIEGWVVVIAILVAILLGIGTWHAKK